MFVSRVDMRGGRRFQIRRGRMSMGFYLISFFFGLVGRNRSVCFVGKKWPSWPSSWMILRLSFLVSSFEVSLANRKGERMKERRGYWPTSDPIQIEQKLKSLVSLSLSSLLGPSSSHFLIPPLEVVVCFVAVDVATLIIDNDNISASVRSLHNSLLRLLSTSLLPPPISLHEEIADKRGSSESKERHTHVYDMAYIGWAGELTTSRGGFCLFPFSIFTISLDGRVQKKNTESLSASSLKLVQREREASTFPINATNLFRRRLSNPPVRSQRYFHVFYF